MFRNILYSPYLQSTALARELRWPQPRKSEISQWPGSETLRKEPLSTPDNRFQHPRSSAAIRHPIFAACLGEFLFECRYR